jgi:hypothetical protein
MSGARVGGERYGAIGRHPISLIDPVLAERLARDLTSHIAASTQRGYDSATKCYLRFCVVRKVSPFPCDSIWVAAWISNTTLFISVRSMKVYLAGVRSSQIDAGFSWHLGDDPMVARALRSAKYRYGMSGQALKVPISLAVVLSMCMHIRGWPNLSRLSHNDLLFVTASTIAVLGFLRGGEFLWSKSSFRPRLLTRDVHLSSLDGQNAVEVMVARPKARWWLTDSSVTCFDPGVGCPLNPSVLLAAYRSRSSVPLRPGDPAFRLADGGILSKEWMLRRTEALLVLAKVALVDSDGKRVPMRASSWRAGGVQSAKAAGLSDSLIQAMGRWSSVAWFNYLFTSRSDLQKASRKMWGSALAPLQSLVVGSFSPAGLFSDNT